MKSQTDISLYRQLSILLPLTKATFELCDQKKITILEKIFF